MARRILYGVLLFVLVAFAWYTLANIDTEDVQDQNYVRVNLRYQAEQEYEPDMAELILGVETTNPNLEQAFSENSTKMDKITAQLQELTGIKINTMNFQVRPTYGEQEQDEQVIIYRVVNQIQVKTDSLKDIGVIIERAISAGANQVLSIHYSLQDLESAQDEVTAQAIKGIEEKADFIRQELNKKEVKLIDLNINNQFVERNFVSLNTPMGKGMQAADQVIPPINPQKIKITVNVNGSYNLR